MFIFKNKRYWITSVLLLLSSHSAFSADGVPPANEEIALEVYKSPTCGCCRKWVSHLSKQNFEVDIQNRNRMEPIKEKYQIGAKFRSCHTAVSNDGYVFEGHIPAKFIRQFLVNPPKNSKGLSVPAVPLGSPGMEVNNKFQPYIVYLLLNDGSSQKFATVNSYEEQF